jgi:DNA-directed RNA polymerase subunit RPC12/RpoP
MRYVPDDALDGKNVIDLSRLTQADGKGPYTYECAVCRKPVVVGSHVQLVNVVLRCPYCGSYSETLEYAL